jgi:hypothetical protein
MSRLLRSTKTVAYPSRILTKCHTNLSVFSNASQATAIQGGVDLFIHSDYEQ